MMADGVDLGAEEWDTGGQEYALWTLPPLPVTTLRT
jgi:hypothetical protein